MSQRRFYRVRDLASEPGREGRYPISRATLWRWVAAGHYPPPLRLSDGITAWPAEVVEEWERARQVLERAAAPSGRTVDVTIISDSERRLAGAGESA